MIDWYCPSPHLPIGRPSKSQKKTTAKEGNGRKQGKTIENRDTFGSGRTGRADLAGRAGDAVQSVDTVASGQTGSSRFSDQTLMRDPTDEINDNTYMSWRTKKKQQKQTNKGIMTCVMSPPLPLSSTRRKGVPSL